MPKLAVVAVSTRPNRAGFPLAQWIFERAKAHGAFDAELVDLRDVGLPLFDEANHPRLRQYEHTKRWSAKVEAADAFIFVTPEYNHGSPPSLINALDSLVHEWAHKPASFVSYGGPSGGTRAVQMVKPMLAALKMVALPESVMVPFFAKSIDAHQVFSAGEMQENHAKMMLDTLAKWIPALATLLADELDEVNLLEVWLTRAEAARYIGAAGESTIRAAEAKGLMAATDDVGQVWHRPERLDDWKWRNKQPSQLQKVRVLREAGKARRNEARARERQRAAEEQREQADWEARMAQYDAEVEAERRVRADVLRRNEEARVAFEAAYMDEQTAGRCLGFEWYEADRRLRGLVEEGLLRRVDSPPELIVIVSFDDIQ